jgi:rhombotail lipoprotein
MGTTSRLAVLLLAVSLAAGCSHAQRTQRSGNLMDYLYPDGRPAEPSAQVPHLRLPLSVGIAFVPARHTRGRGGGMEGGLTEADRARLLERVAAQFRGRPFIHDIQMIPGAYLSAGGGFEDLARLRGLYGVDVVALVSFDQAQLTDQNDLNLTYLTVVGNWLFKGERNDTNTLLDTAVLDVESRKLLFRALGRSRVKGHARPVDQDRELRQDSKRGFELAAVEMTANLDQQLELFRTRVREEPEFVKVSHRRGGGGGGGSADPLWLGLLALVAVLVWQRRRAR